MQSERAVRMAKRIDIASEIGKILADYGADVADSIKDVTRDISKKGAQAVKSNAKADFGGTGKYASGWTSQIETNQYSAQGVIYNKKVPGLPHLLEKGHAKRGGGRVGGKVHIKPVEDEIVRTFEEAVKKAI